MKKMLYITHLSGKRLNRFWLSSIEAAQELDFEFHLACNMGDAEHPAWDGDCEKYGVKTHQIDFNRNPLNVDNIIALKQLYQLLKRERFDFVHCNTPVGGLIGRLCAKMAKVPYVIYQVHGFHFWSGAPLRNWLVFYPAERVLAHLTDVLITINKEDFERARPFKAKRVLYVPGVGINLDMFQKASERSDILRREMGIPLDAHVLLSVGELIKRKNHEVVIRAVQCFDDMWYVICGDGPLRDEYVKLVNKLGIANRVVFAGYRTDIQDFYNMADVFILPSYQEGLSVALMEAMASGLPCVVSDIRGNVDLIKDSSCRFSPDDKKRLEAILRNKVMHGDTLAEESARNRRVVEAYGTEGIATLIKAVYRESVCQVERPTEM